AGRRLIGHCAPILAAASGRGRDEVAKRVGRPRERGRPMRKRERVSVHRSGGLATGPRLGDPGGLAGLVTRGLAGAVAGGLARLLGRGGLREAKRGRRLIRGLALGGLRVGGLGGLALRSRRRGRLAVGRLLLGGLALGGLLEAKPGSRLTRGLALGGLHVGGL